MIETPKVGVVILVRNGNKILLGYRKADLGKGTLAPPGGKLDIGEEIKDCAIRELKEETNLSIKSEDMKFLGVTNDIYSDMKTHYISLFFEVNEYSGELIAMEKDKCEKWDWYDVNTLPDNLFMPFSNFMENNIIE